MTFTPEPPTPIAGYPALATFLSTSPELAVFRKFTSLKMRNLLYMQTELQDLEERLQACEKIVAVENTGRHLADRSYIDLKRRDSDEDARRMEIVDRIRTVMKEYDEALLSTAQVLALPEPRSNIVEILQSHLTYSSKLVDCGERYLSNRDDLASAAFTKTDRMTEFVRRLFGHSLRDREACLEANLQIGYYKSHRIDTIVSILRVLLATGFLAGAIALLCFLGGTLDADMKLKLAVIVCLVVAFNLCLTFTTVASRGEVFGASAAYAAVLVVFVGGTSGNGGN